MKAQHTTQLILPSGQVIELIYVSQGAEALATPVPTANPVTTGGSRVPEPELLPADGLSLECCPECEGTLVYPVWWEEADDDAWAVERRCPCCEWRGVGEYPQDLVDAFDDALTDGTETLLRTLRELVRANMADDVERLVTALDSGLIQPMDF